MYHSEIIKFKAITTPLHSKSDGSISNSSIDPIHRVLFSLNQPYVMNQALKDRLRYFMEEELDIPSLYKSYIIYESGKDVHSCAAISQLRDKGSLLVLVVYDSGLIVGAFTYIGLLSGFTYICDKQACGITYTSNEINIFELGNKMISVFEHYICFGKFGVDFTIDIANVDNSNILLHRILPEDIGMHRSKIVKISVIYDLMKSNNPFKLT